MMAQLDRYILRQMLGPFVFFCIVFGGIIWLNQALRIIDIVVSNQQSGLVFAELSAYLLPKVLETVVPIAGFAAAVFLTNRLYSESELVVMMSVGRSPGKILAPFLIFGGLLFLLMVLLTQTLTPRSVTWLEDRQHDIRQEFLGQFLIEGAFISPQEKVVMFFGTTTSSGSLTDVVINDRRNPEVEVTHVAPSGQLVQGDGDPKILLFDGTVQRYHPEPGNLSVVRFETLAYNLAQFARTTGPRRYLPREVPSSELFNPTSAPATTMALSTRLSEAHGRIVKALLATVVPLIGAIILISAGFSRSGFFSRIVLGVLFMVAVNSFRGWTQAFFVASDTDWPVLYAPVLVAVLVGTLLIFVAQSKFLRRPVIAVGRGAA